MNTPTLTHTQYGETDTLHPVFGMYATGKALAIQMFTDYGEPYATVTVNFPDVAMLIQPPEVVIKDWSENELLVAKMVVARWLEHTSADGIVSGFVTAPIMRMAGPLLYAFNDWKVQPL